MVISRAGPETMGMLLAHRLPAVLCACIRRQRPAEAREEDILGLEPLPRLAVHVLGLLVHPSGPHWEPIRRMPFLETSHEASCSSKPVGMMQENQGDLEVASELTVSVWRDTSLQLMDATGDGSGEGVAVPGDALGAQPGRRDAGNRCGSTLRNDALSVLCEIICGERWASHAALSVGEEQGVMPAATDGVQPSRNCTTPYAPASAKFDALHLLLHSCRSSLDVACAIANFSGGAVIQALLGMLRFFAGDGGDGQVRRRSQVQSAYKSSNVNISRLEIHCGGN